MEKATIIVVLEAGHTSAPDHMPIAETDSACIHRGRPHTLGEAFKLPITCAERATQFDVGEAGEATPHDRVAGGRIARASEIAAKPGDFGQVTRERSFAGRAIGCIRHELVEKSGFHLGQGEAGLGIRNGPIDHGHPEHPPAQDAKDREQFHQALGGS